MGMCGLVGCAGWMQQDRQLGPVCQSSAWRQKGALASCGLLPAGHGRPEKGVCVLALGFCRAAPAMRQGVGIRGREEPQVQQGSKVAGLQVSSGKVGGDLLSLSQSLSMMSMSLISLE